MKILAVSDQIVERVYALVSGGHFREIDLILGCGDLPYEYIEHLVTVLNKPAFYVPGNHDPEYDPRNPMTRAEGAFNIDLKLARHKTFLICGFGGSVFYKPDGVNQYSQNEAFLRAVRLLPHLYLNRIRYGRALDILVSHSPPFGIHDDDSRAHTGLRALNWLLKIAKPRYHVHGHTHFYRNNLAHAETVSGATRIVNVFPYKVIEVNH